MAVGRAGSLSARRAWIEISLVGFYRLFGLVALRKESVDRNNIVLASFRAYTMVALRKESVDRNNIRQIQKIENGVALRKESVDRNNLWDAHRVKVYNVALRKESVDRNRTPHHKKTNPIPSLSARRAWIEI